METITVYHATNVSIAEIGVEKKTMFFTSDLDRAKDWGDSHYDNYHIITTELPLDRVTEYKGETGREQWALYDFERKEVQEFEEEILWMCDCNAGYIVKDVNKYKLSYL
jgi:hypothetical protein